MVPRLKRARRYGKIGAQTLETTARHLNILALDTSTEYCSAALALGGRTFERGELAGQTHSRLVLAMVDALLREAGVALAELDGIAYGEGPGSFTGLRIACGVVQGLALGASLSVVGVGTLLAMAAGSGADRAIVCLDARMNEIYHAAYEKHDGEWRALCDPSVCAAASAPAVPGGGWLGCGSGFRAYREALEARYAAQLAAVDPDLYPHASDIARLAEARFANRESMPPEHAAPVYVRNKVALRTDERASR